MVFVLIQLPSSKMKTKEIIQTEKKREKNKILRQQQFM